MSLARAYELRQQFAPVAPCLMSRSAAFRTPVGAGLTGATPDLTGATSGPTGTTP